MLAALICCATNSISFQKPSIRFVSSDKSPFKDSQKVIASGQNDKPGIIVFNEPGIADEINLSLRKSLADTKITSIIQKTGPNDFTTAPKFDFDAYRKSGRGALDLPSTAEDSPGDWISNLKIGDALIVFDSGNLNNEAMPLEWHPNIAGIIINRRIEIDISNFSEFGHKGFGGFGTMMMSLGHLESPFVNIRFTARVYDFMGTMDTNVGATKNVDGLRFQVQSHSKLNLQAEEPFAVSVRQTGRSGKWWYQLEPAIQEVNGVASWKDNYKSDPFKMPSENRALDKVKQSEILIRGSRAIKDWQAINVLRCTEISGYYSHVPTKPSSAL